MIRAVRANQPTFRAVEFTPGFNVVLADRTKESTKKDSRNGLGKTTLIEIIHYCLGSSSRSAKRLRVEELKEWIFSLELSLGNRQVVVHRSIKTPSRVRLAGDTSGWSQGELVSGMLELHIDQWTEILGREMFGLPSKDKSNKHIPTFRSLIGYMARRGRDAFSVPFEHYRKQKEGDKQISNAFLLGLSWQNARSWQELKDQAAVLETLKKAVTSGVVEGMVGSAGELEAERVRLQEVARRQAAELESFRVHPEYRDIEQRACELTAEIHKHSNLNVMDRRTLGHYENSLTEVEDTEPDSVAKLYEEAGVKLPGAVVRRLEDVQTFHHRLIDNRREFLTSEVERYQSAVAEREVQIQRLSDERAELMKILQEHGALEEYTALQQRHLAVRSQISDVENRLQNLKKFNAGESALKIDKEHLLQRARRDHDERQAIRERAISFFNSNSQALYQAPGRLIIDISEKGFKFNVEIQRSGSEGIDKMKIFCYDLMLAQLWADKTTAPGFLIHDSTLFDGVDERQRALALERAAQVADEVGFQYICTLNSDTLPVHDFSEDFDLHSTVRLRLTDDGPEGSLLGIRY